MYDLNIFKIWLAIQKFKIIINALILSVKLTGGKFVLQNINYSNMKKYLLNAFVACINFISACSKGLVAIVMVSTTNFLVAQDLIDKTKETVSILSLDTKGVSIEPVQAGNLVRLELEKLEQFEVMDRYDVSYLIEKNKLQVNNCYGKICLVEIGETIKSDKMLTGTIELIGNSIIYTLRLVDVKTKSIVKSNVREFLNLPNELQSMTAISVRELLGMETDALVLEKLTKRNNFEGAQNNPDQNRLKLDGPRMGFTLFTGEYASILQQSSEKGGFENYPVMFQFGYQFEAQYLNEGNFQALFEIIPMLTGLDQGRVIPSLSLLNGFRDNRKGWEFAFGPVFYPIKRSRGYYDSNGDWNRMSDWKDSISNPYPLVKRIDSRGLPELTSGFIFAFGRTFKSGKLNIPVNGYVVPGKYGWRFGFSFGFNVKKAKPQMQKSSWSTQ